MVAIAIDVPAAEIEQFCRRHRIRRMALFGSVVDGRFGPASDVDILVDFTPGDAPGLAFIDMQDELSALLGHRRVDLVTAKFLNRRIRDSVLASAKVIYEE